MSPEPTWEEETLRLIDEAKKEERRAEQRVASAERALATARQNRTALETALSIYRKSYGVADEPEIDPSVAASYQGLGLKEMVRRWAAEHGGEVRINNLAAFVTVAGLFPDKAKAASALYTAARRLDEFDRVGRGVFRNSGGPRIISNGHIGPDDEKPALVNGETNLASAWQPPTDFVDVEPEEYYGPSAEDEKAYEKYVREGFFDDPVESA